MRCFLFAQASVIEHLGGPRDAEHPLSVGAALASSVHRFGRSRVPPARTDNYDGEEFKFNSELGISIKGQSAADAWNEIDRIAKKWRIPVVVELQWRENPKAQ